MLLINRHDFFSVLQVFPRRSKQHGAIEGAVEVDVQLHLSHFKAHSAARVPPILAISGRLMPETPQFRCLRLGLASLRCPQQVRSLHGSTIYGYGATSP